MLLDLYFSVNQFAWILNEESQILVTADDKKLRVLQPILLWKYENIPLHMA